MCTIHEQCVCRTNELCDRYLVAHVTPKLEAVGERRDSSPIRRQFHFGTARVLTRGIIAEVYILVVWGFFGMPLAPFGEAWGSGGRPQPPVECRWNVFGCHGVRLEALGNFRDGLSACGVAQGSFHGATHFKLVWQGLTIYK